MAWRGSHQETLKNSSTYESSIINALLAEAPASTHLAEGPLDGAAGRSQPLQKCPHPLGDLHPYGLVTKRSVVELQEQNFTTEPFSRTLVRWMIETATGTLPLLWSRNINGDRGATVLRCGRCSRRSNVANESTPVAIWIPLDFFRSL